MIISTPLRSKILSHTRSVSLPTKSHPLIPQFSEYLHRLRPSSCENSSISSPLPSITNKLNTLDELYNCIDDLLLLPHTQQVFAKECQEKWVEETLDGYLMLVDACATAKDFVFHAKQELQDLLSVLRRRRSETNDLSKFFISRKNLKKMVHKSLRNITSFKNKPTNFFALEKDQETIAIISMFKETESITLDLIESLLTSIAGSKSYQRASGWSIVSKLMNTRKEASDKLEFEELDATMCKLVGYRASSSSKCVIDHDLQCQIKEMDLSIQIVEERLECLFKRLIRTRVSLLNMQSQ